MSIGPCLGDLVAAVVDGELDHAARERAHRHLAHCAGCRADVEAQRRLKSRLSGASGADLSDGLTARLIGLGAGAPAPEARRLPTGPSRPVSPAVTGRPATGRPAGRARRLRVGSAAAVAGLGVVLALGGSQPATTPVNPGTDAFVAEFVSTTGSGGTPGVTRAGLTGGDRGSR